MLPPESTPPTPLPPVTTAVAQPTLDWPKATAHLELVKANILTHAGKPEHNPYWMLSELGVAGMEIALKKKAYSPELFVAIMGLSTSLVPHVKNLKAFEEGWR